jgi:4-amino-4-deoxy-L-arabinose transferase-like glycosyltransferase
MDVARLGHGPAITTKLIARWARRRALALIYLAALLPAIVMALGQPVWSRVDEAQHYDLIAQYANGSHPVEGVTRIRPETLAVMERTGIYRWSARGSEPPPVTPDGASFAQPPAGLTAVQRNLWDRRHLWSYSYEAMQPPLYYLAMVPFWWLGNLVGGAFGALFAVRLVDAAIIALLAPLAWLLAREMAPGRTELALTAAATVALVPGVLLNTTQISNDGPAAVAGAGVALLALRGATRGFTPLTAAAVGLLFGVTMLLKLTGGGLVLGLAAAFLLPVPRARSGRILATALAQARLSGIAVAAGAAVLVPWLIANETVYRRLLPPTTLLSAVFPAQSMSAPLYGLDAIHVWLTFWAGEPVNVLPFGSVVALAALIWVVGAAIGLARLARSGRLPVVPVAVVGLLAGGELAWAMASLRLAGLGGTTPGRYVYPAVVPISCLLALGTTGLIAAAQVRRGVLAGVAACFVGATEVFLVGGTTSSDYQPPPVFELRPVAAATEYQGVRIRLDGFAVDATHRHVWVHVEVDNTTGQAVDWWPKALVKPSSGPAARIDYQRSEPFPETLTPGERVGGWMVAPTGAKQTDWTKAKVVFQDVATDDYHQVGDVALEVNSIPSTAGR